MPITVDSMANGGGVARSPADVGPVARKGSRVQPLTKDSCGFTGVSRLPDAVTRAKHENQHRTIQFRRYHT